MEVHITNQGDLPGKLAEGHSWKSPDFDPKNMEIRGVEFFQNGFEGSSLIISRPFSEFEGLQKGWDLSSRSKNNSFIIS